MQREPYHNTLLTVALGFSFHGRRSFRQRDIDPGAARRNLDQHDGLATCLSSVAETRPKTRELENPASGFSSSIESQRYAS